MKILITRADGQLGRELANQYKGKKGIDLILTDVLDLDITDVHQVYSFINENKQYVIINCAALTAVDKCETEIDMAYKINTIGPKSLASAANHH